MLSVNLLMKLVMAKFAIFRESLSVTHKIEKVDRNNLTCFSLKICAGNANFLCARSSHPICWLVGVSTLPFCCMQGFRASKFARSPFQDMRSTTVEFFRVGPI
jgi:hypothetical protein